MGAADPGWSGELVRGLRLAVAADRLVRSLEAVRPGAGAGVRDEVLARLRDGLLDGPAAVAAVIDRIAAGALDDQGTDEDDFWAGVEARLTAPSGGGPPATLAAVVRGEAAGRSPPPDWPGLAAWWVTTGAALAVWADLAPVVHQVADTAEDWHQLAAVLDADPGDGYRAATAALLRHLARPAESSVRELSVDLARFRREVRSAPTGWPPFAAREVWRAARLWAAVPPVPAAPPPAELRGAVGSAAAPRVWAVVILADHLDLSPTPHGSAVWDVLAAAAAGVLGPAGLTLTLDRDGTGPAAVAVEDPHVAAPVVEQTGLAVSTGGKVAWGRPARVRRPPDPPPVTAGLRLAAEQDPEVAAECRAALRSLGGRRPDPDWWAARTAEERGVWWRLAQQAALRRDRVGAVLAAAVADAGIRVEPVPPDGVEDGPWFVGQGAVGSATAAAPCAVGFPAGPSVAPAVWVRIGPPDRPLARCLAGCWPLLYRLRAADPRWPGWGEYNDAVWRLVTTPAGDPAADAGAGVEAFEAVYARATDGGQWAGAFRDLAARLYECLTAELGVRIVPQLEPTTLLPKRLDRESADGTEIDWVDGAETGRVCRVVRFARDGRPSRVWAEVGAGKAALVPWLALPDRPGGKEAWLYRRLRDVVWAADGAARFRKLVAAVGRWVADDGEGAAWFRAAGPDSPWVARLVADGACRCYPARDPGTGRVGWPADAPPNLPSIEWEFHDAVERRCLIRNARYGPTPARAGGVFSLGPEAAAGPALRAAARLRAAAPDAPPAQAAWTAGVAAHLGHSPGAGPELAVVDWLPAAPAGAVEPAREWLAARGVTLLPAAGGDPPDPQPRFDSAPPGTVRVERYGYRSAAGGRDPVVVRSAGPEPAGYRELVAELDRLGHPKLADLLREWPAADPGQLSYDACWFYERFYDECGAHPPPAVWARAAELVARVLAARFGYTPFTVATFGERAESDLEYDSSTGIGNGRVTRVHRPGLQSADGKMKVTTKVSFGGGR